MTNEELIKEHLENKCKYCDIKDCDGIHITIDHKTRCNKDELHSKWNNRRLQEKKSVWKEKNVKIKNVEIVNIEGSVIIMKNNRGGGWWLMKKT